MLSPDKKAGHSSKTSKKGLSKKTPDFGNYSLTPEDLIKLGKQYAGLESPIDISFQILTEALLPPMEWVNFEKSPKRMKISNSGTTAILSAKWHGPRPYLTKGPLTGCYVFSQLHFHWGGNSEEGSEHTMNGHSLPLEVHVMFFKNTYMTQEDAMKKVDGTVTIAYLFTGKDNEDLNCIITALNEIQNPLTSYHLELLPLTKFLHVFTDDYFMYWGNVVDRSILWIISRRPLGISLHQLALFHSMIGTNDKPISKNFRSTKEINHRIVYHINPSKYKGSLLIDPECKNRIDNTQKSFPNKQNDIIVSQLEVKNPVGRGDESVKDKAGNDSSQEEVSMKSEKTVNEDININISLLTGKLSEYSVSKYSEGRNDTNEEFNNLHPSISNNSCGKFDMRNKSQIKLQLATALLNLEKEEGNDYSFLEKYLKTKYDSLQFEQCYHSTSGDSRQTEEMLLPSVRSLQMNCNLYELQDCSNASAIKEKSKSDTHCLKGFPQSGIESDSERNSIGESNKSGWSSINSISEKDDKSDKDEGTRHCSPVRPRTSTAKLADRRRKYREEMAQREVGSARPRAALNHRSTSKLSIDRPSRPGSVNPEPQQLLPQPSKDRSILDSRDLKNLGQTVEEARGKIRSSLRKSMTKLIKMGGATADLMKPKNPETKTRPAWRY